MCAKHTQFKLKKCSLIRIQIYFQILPLLLATLALSKAGVIEKQSSVSVKHVGKDFSYSIEETHRMGLGSSSEFQQQKSDVSIVTAANIDGMKSNTNLSPTDSQEKEFVDEQALADQTVQIIPESALTGISSDMEGQVKNVEGKEENSGSALDSKSQSVDTIHKDATSVPNEYHGKGFILFDPHTKGMIGKPDVHQIYNQAHQPVKVIYPNYRTMHNGFRFYQPFGYYYPVGMVRLV